MEQEVKRPNSSRIKAALWVIAAQLLMPFVKWMGEVKAPFSEKKAIEDFYQICDVIKPLDIILSNTRGHLSNVFSPGYWKHVIVYIGKENGIPMIMEAIGSGVVKRPLVECLAEKDEIAIVRYIDYKKAKKIDVEKAIKFCKKMEGAEYDYIFDMFSERKFENFYCSELGYEVHKKAFKKYKMGPRETFGVQTITPTDFYNAKNKYIKIFRTREEK